MTRGRTRPEPVIQDHKVLRMIGGGSYGEVWLASSVTGSMRAVKVVRREDFDDERTFEREFEGILKYEPLSRDHPGLVHILHIGRGVDIHDNPFYYYVMELGDDVHSGTSINPVEYEARNLLIDMKHSGGKPLDPDEVITIGLCLSDALSFLHEKGLVHRDIKPSNVIFVDGKAKLADIGLVAARGQRTFVGTEGFVPPEGPGTAQADVYGLGKVLYEMTTGRDRLDFPELPDDLPEVAHKKRWLALNQLVCDVCEPRQSKRTIKTAAGLADGLKRLQEGRRLKQRKDKTLITIIPIILLLGLAAWASVGWINSIQNNNAQIAPPETPQYGFVKVLSDPTGAEVYNANGEFLDITPLKNIKMKAGSTYEFEFSLDGFRTGRETGIVEAGETIIVDHLMAIYSPPVEGEDWIDHNGMLYQPYDGHHISKSYVSNSRWRRYPHRIKGKDTDTDTQPTSKAKGRDNQYALVTEAEANSYAEWLSNTARARGYLNEKQSIYAVVDKKTDTSKVYKGAKKHKLYPFKTMVKNIPFARLELHSTPSGASVLINEKFSGYTPVYLSQVKPGEVNITLNYEGYRKYTHTVNLQERASERLDLEMKPDDSVVFGENWENSLGMKFVPIGDQDNLLVSIWETRVTDYDKHGSEQETQRPAKYALSLHPVLNISREKAEKFCQRLTKHQQEQEHIPEDARYRLLTDWEWSLIAGIIEDPDKQPAEREFNSPNLFPWGDLWPPHKAPFLVGNLAGEEVTLKEKDNTDRIITGYDDGHVKSSPVGSFPPNTLGIHDLAGNAYEWVSDDYSGSSDYGVLRGGSWNSYLKEHLYIAHRNVVKPSKRNQLFGFRVILEKDSQ